MAHDFPRVPVRIVLEDIRSGLNVGAFFRTADAFALEAIELCGYTALPPHRDILKSALGATETVPWRAHATATDALALLRAEGWRTAAIEQVDGATALEAWAPAPGERWALVFGNEVHGVSAEAVAACEIAVHIPQFGTKKSLNVSVCGGIALWHAARSLRP